MKTKNFIFPVVFCIIISIFSISCEKDEDIQLKLEKMEGKGYFPMQIGNYWKFPHGVKIEIDAIEVINEIEYFRFIKEWEYLEAPTKEYDTSYYRKTIDNKIVYLKKSNIEVLLYDLSAEVGDIWTTSKGPKDSTYTKLSSINNTIEVNNILFNKCNRYFHNSYNKFLIDDESSTWLAPNIGIIQTADQTGIMKLEEVQIDGIKIKFKTN